MGPDGHTCSLFPDPAVEVVPRLPKYPAVVECGDNPALILPVVDSPKPPPLRVTMSFKLINAARCCVFAMAGQGKAEMVKRILTDEEALPAGKVRPEGGDLYWILDEAAASLM